MDYQDDRTLYGRFMFNLLLKSSRFLMKHMWLYYILNYTWGILTTFVGWLVFGFIRLFLIKKILEKGKFGPCLYLIFGNNWGGLELGTNFFVAGMMGEYWTLHTKQHECGHTFQNAVLGPLAIFLVYIPSCIRYWLFEFRKRKGKYPGDYESIWFEGNATAVGKEYYNNYLNH